MVAILFRFPLQTGVCGQNMIGNLHVRGLHINSFNALQNLPSLRAQPLQRIYHSQFQER